VQRNKYVGKARKGINNGRQETKHSRHLGADIGISNLSCYSHGVMGYPEKDFPNFQKMNGPRGVVYSWATDVDDVTTHERWRKVGKQKIEEPGL
jgi:hypothetical protein